MLGGRGVLLSTYGMLLHNSNSLAGTRPGRTSGGCASGKPLWDVLILDEVLPQGHGETPQLPRLSAHGCWCDGLH